MEFPSTPVRLYKLEEGRREMFLISQCQLLLEFGWGRGVVKSIGYVLIYIIILYRWWRFRACISQGSS